MCQTDATIAAYDWLRERLEFVRRAQSEMLDAGYIGPNDHGKMDQHIARIEGMIRSFLHLVPPRVRRGGITKVKRVLIGNARLLGVEQALTRRIGDLALVKTELIRMHGDWPRVEAEILALKREVRLVQTAMPPAIRRRQPGQSVIEFRQARKAA